MKKLLILNLLVACTIVVNAQNTNVQSAWASGLKPGATQYKKALDFINKAIEHPDTKENDKAWCYRGQIYHAIYQSKKSDDKALVEEPLMIAIESYKTSLKFKSKSDEYFNKSLENLNVARVQAFTEGIHFFEKKQFQKAVEYFEASLEIGLIPQINRNESAVYYNLALSAEEAGDMAKAKQNYILSLENNHEPLSSTRNIASICLKEGDTLCYVNTLKTGIEKTVDNQQLMLMLIDYYSKANQYDEAIDYLDKAIEKEPENKIYYFVKGTFYDGKGMVNEAYEAYSKVLQFDNQFIDAYYNIGVLFFNSGADFNNKANDIPPDKEKEYAEMREKAAEEFIKSCEYFEKFLKFQPDDMIVMKQLRTIYRQLYSKPGFEEKWKALDEKIKAIE